MRREVYTGVLVIGLSIVISTMSYFYVFKGEKEIEIVSFEKKVDENLSSYLSLNVENYWVEGDAVLTNGAVNFVGPSDSFGIGRSCRVLMSIDNLGNRTIKVEIYLITGKFETEESPMDLDSRPVPILGGEETLYPSSFDFLLSCSYE
ncbi:hypothetical protein AKJ57_00295 [candidate division MSBL1 archaeon SCGC-AAA259A05]|uniref:Uncharacterized protein n=1 Tax=candidate division MSBL1 archaeon SCGC-AAA259A05 TaxID=1698259 RepID=A0A133UBW0_9EURY|nr:hypothetical protein AKJ57_00295 [candidate division MSBL1 archaeon SCGC-AAA259A05]